MKDLLTGLSAFLKEIDVRYEGQIGKDIAGVILGLIALAVVLTLILYSIGVGERIAQRFSPFIDPIAAISPESALGVVVAVTTGLLLVLAYIGVRWIRGRRRDQ